MLVSPVELVDYLKCHLKVEFGEPYNTRVEFTEQDLERLANHLSNDQSLGYPGNQIKFNARQRFIQAVSLLGITPSQWKEILIKNPDMIFDLPATINTNIEGCAEILGMDKLNYFNRTKGNSRNLRTRPEVLESHIEQGSIAFGMERKKLLAVYKKNILMAFQNPHILKAKADLYSTYYGLNDILENHEDYLTYAPERILGHYALARLTRQRPEPQVVKKNPQDFLDRIKDPNQRKVITIVYKYFDLLWRKKREQRRGAMNIEARSQNEIEAYRTMAEFIDEYFGRPEDKVDYKKIGELLNKTFRHVQKRVQRVNAKMAEAQGTGVPEAVVEPPDKAE